MRHGPTQEQPPSERPSARRLQGGAAVATWSLRRRRVVDASHEQAMLLSQVLCDAQVHLAQACVSYRGRRAAVRPVVAGLLARLLGAGGRPVPVAELCDAVYGRPASLRAIRQSAFRASRVMERLDCPLVICCHSATVFARHRVRHFERRLASPNPG